MKTFQKYMISLLAVSIVASVGVMNPSYAEHGVIKPVETIKQSINHYLIKPKNTEVQNQTVKYEVLQDQKSLKSFTDKNHAVSYATNLSHASIEDSAGNTIWDNYSDYKVYQNQKLLKEFGSILEAISYAKQFGQSSVYFSTNKNPVWQSQDSRKSSAVLDVPFILQNPELARGCEVTSLAMLLQSAGVKVGKTELAKQINKVPYTTGDGIHGNPNDGFVGDIYSFDNDGYGVYHGPIKDLGAKYLGNRMVDLTGMDLNDVLSFVNEGKPVWVVANDTFNTLDSNSIETWQTNEGPVQITWDEHSVLITGYDQNNIYINDPLDANGKNKILPRSAFESAWDQMGKQAVSYI